MTIFHDRSGQIHLNIQAGDIQRFERKGYPNSIKGRLVTTIYMDEECRKNQTLCNSVLPCLDFDPDFEGQQLRIGIYEFEKMTEKE